jgi:hypothetical protein
LFIFACCFEVFLFFFRNLKNLNLTDVENCKNIEYICALLEYEFPNLQIIGVDFKSEVAIEKAKEKLDKEDKLLNEKFNVFDDKNKKFLQYFQQRAEFISKNNF